MCPVETRVPGGGAIDPKAIVETYTQVSGLDAATVEIVGTAQWERDRIQSLVEKTHDALRP